MHRSTDDDGRQVATPGDTRRHRATTATTWTRWMARPAGLEPSAGGSNGIIFRERTYCRIPYPNAQDERNSSPRSRARGAEFNRKYEPAVIASLLGESRRTGSEVELGRTRTCSIRQSNYVAALPAKKSSRALPPSATVAAKRFSIPLIVSRGVLTVRSLAVTGDPPKPRGRFRGARGVALVAWTAKLPRRIASSRRGRSRKVLRC